MNVNEKDIQREWEKENDNKLKKEANMKKGTEMKTGEWTKETKVRRSYQLECAIANLRQVGWGRKRSFCNCEKKKDIQMKSSLIDKLNNLLFEWVDLGLFVIHIYDDIDD